MRRPSFQFYPGDWQANSNLRRCTHEEKGVWLDIMCLLHDQEEYGVARWSLKELAQAVGAPVAKVKSLVVKGILKGSDAGSKCDSFVFVPTAAGRKKGDPVTLVNEQEGPLWYSSRMVVDEYKRVVRGEHGGSPKGAPDSAPKPPISATPKDAPDLAPDLAPFTRGCVQASRADPSSSSSSSVNPKASEANASGGEPPKVTDPDEIIFGYGVPLLTNAGTAEKQARSFLGGLRKAHGDGALIEKLRDCMRAKPLQPLEWLAAALPPKGGSPKPRAPAPENFSQRDYGVGGML